MVIFSYVSIWLISSTQYVLMIIEKLQQLLHIRFIFNDKVNISILGLNGQALPRIKWNLLFNRIQMMRHVHEVQLFSKRPKSGWESTKDYTLNLRNIYCIWWKLPYKIVDFHLFLFFDLFLSLSNQIWIQFLRSFFFFS